MRRSKRTGVSKQSLEVRYSRSLPDSAFAKKFERLLTHHGEYMSNPDSSVVGGGGHMGMDLNSISVGSVGDGIS